jgi:hypothetical protein
MRNNLTFTLDMDLGVLIAWNGGKVCVPVLEFDKIGENGDFTKPFTFDLQLMDSSVMYGQYYKRVSRNKVPKRMKDIFKRAFAGEVLKGVARAEIGVA